MEYANTSSDATITILDAANNPQMSRLSFFLRYLSIFLSIEIFGVLRVISRVQADVFPTVHALHDLDLSSDILRGTGIYQPLGKYFSIQSYPIVHTERVHPTFLMNLSYMYCCIICIVLNDTINIYIKACHMLFHYVRVYHISHVITLSLYI